MGRHTSRRTRFVQPSSILSNGCRISIFATDGDLLMTRGEFLKVKCDECGNEQVVFSKPAGDVACVVCDDILATAQGGKARLNAEVVSTAS